MSVFSGSFFVDALFPASSQYLSTHFSACPSMSQLHAVIGGQDVFYSLMCSSIVTSVVVRKRFVLVEQHHDQLLLRFNCNPDVLDSIKVWIPQRSHNFCLSNHLDVVYFYGQDSCDLRWTQRDSLAGTLCPMLFQRHSFRRTTGSSIESQLLGFRLTGSRILSFQSSLQSGSCGHMNLRVCLTPRRWLLLPYQEVWTSCPMILLLPLEKADAPCSVSTALPPSSSSTSSSRSTTLSGYFWSCIASSACCRWQSFMKEAQRAALLSFFACRTTSAFRFPVLKSHTGKFLGLSHSFSTAFGLWSFHQLFDSVMVL